MSDPAFDTLVAARKLKTAGIEAEQADAIVEVMGESVNQLVTVEHFDAGLAMLHTRFDGQSSRIDSLQADLHTRTDGLSNRIDSLQADLHTRTTGLSDRIDSLQTQLQAQIDGLSGRIDNLRIEMRADVDRSLLIFVSVVIAANALMLTVLGILLNQGAIT